METNNGIINNNGQITSKVIAVGENAKVYSTIHEQSTDTSEVRVLSQVLEDLMSKLNTLNEPVRDKEDIVASISVLKEEIAKEKPSKITLGSIGKGVAESLKYVAELAPLATTMWKHIASLL